MRLVLGSVHNNRCRCP